jgi:hypothetical protein
MVSQASRSYDESDSTNPEKESAFEARQRESLVRPTPEMQRILARRAAQEIRRQSLSWKDQLAEYNQRSVFLYTYSMSCNDAGRSTEVSFFWFKLRPCGQWH